METGSSRVRATVSCELDQRFDAPPSDPSVEQFGGSFLSGSQGASEGIGLRCPQ